MAQGAQRLLSHLVKDGGVMDLDRVPNEVFGKSPAWLGVVIADI